MQTLRSNIALAIDGGGVKGLIVARALAALEQELGGAPLIQHPNLKVLAGTSTGAVIAAGLALGMTAAELTAIYLNNAAQIFPPVLPEFLPYSLHEALKIALRLFRPSLYDGVRFKELLRETARQKTGNPDITLGELRGRLRSDQAIVFTVVDVTDRRTKFLKTYADDDANWTLWEAVMASSAAPTYLPVIARPDPNRRTIYYADGGTGSYGNPAYIAAREMVEWQQYDPAQTSVISFGTGWVKAPQFEQANGKPDDWTITSWISGIIAMLIGDSARAQSLDILNDFGPRNIDLRRFQVTLDTDFDLDDARAATLQRLAELGDQLAERVRQNQHALTDPAFDPEGLRRAVERYQRSIAQAR